MIRVPRQSLRRLRLLVFFASLGIIVTLGSYMFGSYTSAIASHADYLTLGFSHVYVISERQHTKRRRAMVNQLRFQGIPHGFYPATTVEDIDHPEKRRFWLGEENWTPAPENHTEPSELLATFRSHMNVISDIVRLEYKSALVLEDRVDMEVDVKQRMKEMLPRVPPTWEILYLGHCSSKEDARPTGLHRSLFVSDRPRCTFAYALSRLGAIRLKRVLDNMWPSPGVAIDQALADMIHPMYLEAYSIEPPVIVQVRPNSPSGSAVGPEIRRAAKPRLLQNSTLHWIGMPSKDALKPRVNMNI
ncbi:hypothetical protein GQ54DRAFT_192214 [Martensiomyces pterosporus]|nr:hypothetical protein GQ54DRAFT_192214 [Martensiomyces pterosporus]